MSKKEYRDYIQDILDSIRDIYDFVGTMTLQEFKKDKGARARGDYKKPNKSKSKALLNKYRISIIQ